MRSIFRVAFATVAALGIVSCGDSSTDPDDAPRVEHIAVAAAPIPPPGNLVQCYTGPDGVTLDTVCPVIKWNDVTYWIFAYDDNRNSLNVVAYDDDENILSQNQQDGSERLYQIAVITNNRTVVLYGFSAATATIPWAELEVD